MNIVNCKYEYRRDKAITESIRSIIEALHHGPNCPAFVHIHDQLNCMALPSR